MNKEKRVGVSLHADAYRTLQQIQDELERKVGFRPSLSQVVEYLVASYQDKIVQQTN